MLRATADRQILGLLLEHVRFRWKRTAVIVCDKRKAFAQGSKATKQSIYVNSILDCFATLAMTLLVQTKFIPL